MDRDELEQLIALTEAPLDRHEVERMINRAIRLHELRVAIASGGFGLLLIAGTWHAIWMCRPPSIP